jgi:branched-chain amino acid aminotransferase
MDSREVPLAILSRPKYVFMGGKLRRWEEAMLHIGCEAVTRGLNVFEGVRGFWQSDGRFGIVMLRRHYERLRRSARLLHIPFHMTFEAYTEGIHELVGALVEPTRDMWARTTLYVTEGHWGEDTVADLVMTAYHMETKDPQSVDLGISTWRRSADVSLPPRIKAGTNYQVARLAKIEGRRQGCQDMILLNQWGRVAEATTACVLMVREGVVYTPPATEGCLESITVDVIEALAHSMNINFIRRPIDYTELLVADEIALCGTLAGVALVRSIGGVPLPTASTVLKILQSSYGEAVRGLKRNPFIEMSYLPKRMHELAGTEDN